MFTLPELRRPTLPTIGARVGREAMLHVALLGMTLTVAALLAYISERDADDLAAAIDQP